MLFKRNISNKERTKNKKVLYALYGILTSYGKLGDALGVEAYSPYLDKRVFDFILALASNRVRVLGSDPGLAWLLRSDQAELKEVFELLAKDEVEHEAQFRKLLEKTPPDEDVSTGPEFQYLRAMSLSQFFMGDMKEDRRVHTA